jgi:hypothetical protein
MSLQINTIDCPCLTRMCLEHLEQRYSIRTTTDFLIWIDVQSIDDDRYLSIETKGCIQACIIAHTSSIVHRSDNIQVHCYYQLNNTPFDYEHILHAKRHLLFIYSCFHQYQWNQFFNFFLLRLFLNNTSIKVKYIQTNPSLFDLKYFYDYYCSLNSIMQQQRDHLFEHGFIYQSCFQLETLESELLLMENATTSNSIQILIIDDLLSLIRPYIGLDHRIRHKIQQLTYRFNRLAQKQSLLIINGLILWNTKSIDSSFDTHFDLFHADDHVRLQSLTSLSRDIHIEIHEKTFVLPLDQWTDEKLLTSS